jgi:hypothetical protein
LTAAELKRMKKHLLILTLVLAHGAAFGQTPDEKANDASVGTISGRVVSDGSQALSNAAVSVQLVNSAQRRITIADADGRFTITGLDRGSYTVNASMPAFVMRPRDPNDPQSPIYHIGDSLRLELIKGGVITGTVTSASGEPVVGVRVRAVQVRDSFGESTRGAFGPERTTDDRGIYRIYGIPPGTYVVVAGGGRSFVNFGIDPFDHDVPTFAPSGTRETATEFQVEAGQEISSVDIRYRGEPGHTISGTVKAFSTVANTMVSINISITRLSNPSMPLTSNGFLTPYSQGFALHGLADGEYELTAQSFTAGARIGGLTVTGFSDPVRITVSGADVSGVELVTKPLGSLNGRFVLENSSAPECKGKHLPLFAESLISAQREEKSDGSQPRSTPFIFSQGTISSTGEFTVRNLLAGRYRFNPRFFARYWYLKSITAPATPPAGAKGAARSPLDASRNWVNLKAGEQLSGITVTLAAGAASLRGSVKPEEGQKNPPRMLLHLIPAEKEASSDPLRFFSTLINDDGTFALGNISPGRYWILARTPGNDESQLSFKLRQPDGTELRAKLRREAENAKTEIEFKPCQNITDYEVTLKGH